MTTLLTRTPDTDLDADLDAAPTGSPLAATPAPETRAPDLPVARQPTEHDAPAPAPVEAPADRVVAGTSRLVLSGALTRADAPWLEPELDRLAHGGAPVVELDLSDVPSMDAVVARLLLRTSWHLGDPARRLLLVHPQPLVHRVLRYYGAGSLVVRAPRPAGRRSARRRS